MAFWLGTLALAIWYAMSMQASAAAESGRALRLEDAADIEELEIVPSLWSVSQNGLLAVVRSRPLKARARFWDDARDIWVEPAAGHELINLTNGHTDGSDWQQPLWSPDGARLAMVSTRGGYRRIWIWERATGRLEPLPTQGPVSFDPFFAWVDNRRLLCKLLADGEPPETLDAWRDPARAAMDAWTRMWEGRESTASVLSTGLEEDAASVPGPARWPKVDVRVVDVVARSSVSVLGSFHPMRYHGHAVMMAPGGRFVALARHGAPVTVEVRKQTVVLEVRSMDGSVPRFRAALPEHVLLGTPRWSLDGTELAFFARGSDPEATPRLYRANALRGSIQEFDLGDLDVTALPNDNWAMTRLEWTETGDLVFSTQIQPKNEDAQRRWWLLTRDGRRYLLTSPIAWESVPSFLQRVTRQGSLVGVAKGELWKVDAKRHILSNVTVSFAPRITEVVWPETIRKRLPGAVRNYIIQDEDRPRDGRVVVAARSAGNTSDDYYLLDLNSGASKLLKRPDGIARFARMDPAGTSGFYTAEGLSGAALWRVNLHTGKTDRLLELNTFLRNVRRARSITIDYVGLNGANLKGLVLLPLNYKAGRRYPVITKVYPEWSASTWQRLIESYELRPLSPFCLQIAAAADYAVLFPDMPPFGERPHPRADVFLEVANGVMPAVDRLIQLGLADPDRLFVTGASHGGFATYALVTQTDRFKAAVVEAGKSNFMSAWGTFGPNRYTDDVSRLGIAWPEWNTQNHLKAPPWEDLGRYLRNSPIFYVERVETPVMIVHNDFDGSVPMQQGEEFFSALHRLNKPAQFVRYWGEGHGNRNPHNIRDQWQRTFAWFDQWGDISRDATGELVFDGDRVKSRNGAAPMKAEDYDVVAPFRHSSGGSDAAKQGQKDAQLMN